MVNLGHRAGYKNLSFVGLDVGFRRASCAGLIALSAQCNLRNKFDII
jgi:hypothetical protein